MVLITMQNPVMYLVICAVVGLLGAAQGAALDLEAEPSPDAMPATDMFTYMMPKFGQYRTAEQWNGVPEQEMFLDSGNVDQMPEERFKRAGSGPSLSIINPLDVLRQRLLLEMARRQMRESQRQVAENRKFMETIGKRGNFLRQPYLLGRGTPLM